MKENLFDEPVQPLIHVDNFEQSQPSCSKEADTPIVLKEFQEPQPSCSKEADYLITVIPEKQKLPAPSRKMKTPALKTQKGIFTAASINGKNLRSNDKILNDTLTKELSTSQFKNIVTRQSIEKKLNSENKNEHSNTNKILRNKRKSNSKKNPLLLVQFIKKNLTRLKKLKKKITHQNTENKTK